MDVRRVKKQVHLARFYGVSPGFRNQLSRQGIVLHTALG